jgi:FHS family Na+ dependent glucose MFS transporter 1
MASSVSSSTLATSAERSQRIASTGGYYAAFIGLGLVAASLGPTLPGLAENTRTQLSEISYLFTGRSLGYLCGSLLAGRLYDRVPGHPLMAAMLGIVAVALLLVPSATQLWLLIAILVGLGVAEGLIDVGGNSMLVWVNRENVGPYMNGLHFFFGVGTFVSPILIAQMMLRPDGLSWAYWLLALLILPVSLWVARVRSPRRLTEGPSASVAVTNYRLTALVAFFLFLNVGVEVSLGGWIYTYAVTLGLESETVAAYLTSVLWGSFTLSRLIGIPIAARVRPRTILLADLIGCLVGVLLILLLPASRLALWAGVVLTGAAMAAIFPVTLSWAERRMTLTGFVTSWFFVGASLGGMVFPWLIGQLFESWGPRITMITVLADVLIAFVVFGLLMVYGGQPRRDEG